MASSQPTKGRGRGRGATHSTGPPPPSITPSTDISASTTPFTIDTTRSSDSPGTHESVSPIPTTIGASRPDTGFSSASSDTQPAITSSATIPKSKGRGSHQKKNIVPDDPHWMVTNLTDAQFNSISRPKKPDELGTLGQQIQVIANYFPILQYPHKGLVYQYHIQIRHRKNLEIHRERRRVLYNSWLQGLCRRYPQIDKHKIVFDNQSTILVFDEPLPNIDENDVVEMIMGPNRSNRQEAHKVIVQRVGSPVDLSLIQNLTELFDTANESNDRLEDLQKVKQVLSIALHEHCSSHASFIYNRSFYAPAVEGQYGEWDLGLGKQMWRGFYSCLVFAKGKHKLLMNLDVSHTVFLKKQPFLDFLCEIMRQSPCGKQQYSRQRNVQKVDVNDVLRYLDSRFPSYDVEADYVLKHCKHLRVRSQDADKPIVYDIQKLGLSASRQEFEWKSNNKRMITVENYYKEHYNLTLKYPSLPTLEMRNRSYLPMELVDVEPVRVKKITDEQRALLCRYSSIKPLDYCKSIKKIRDNPDQQCFEQDPFVAAWNLNVDIKMLTVPARVLPMPEIVYTNQYRVKPEGVRDVGTWELRPTQFHTPTNFPKVWAMINLTSLYENACKEFYNQLKNSAEQRGIDCPAPKIYEEHDAEHVATDQIVYVLKEMMKKNDDCKFFIVILPPKTTRESKQAYRTLKKLCELEVGFGIVTQMIQVTNAVIGKKNDKTKWDYAKLSNIMLKINTKLKGTNSVLKVHDIIERFFIRGHRIMYVGADLSHPAPGAGNQVSVVAVVASADDIPNRYFKEVYKQERPAQTRKESRDIIVSMREIMKSLIQQYEQHRGCPPTAIVIYRDGISEGEFYTVFEKELMATRQACADLSPVYRPCLTYIVVNKKHRTRFFPTDLQKNVLAGTVVDSHDITNATTYDFYLNSHHGALGTSRPTHYHVLYDDNHLKPDEVQMLTYALCYTYARCTRSVSIPAPVKYADLLAFRATYYVAIDDGSETESVASGPRVPLNEDTDKRTFPLWEYPQLIIYKRMSPSVQGRGRGRARTEPFINSSNSPLRSPPSNISNEQSSLSPSTRDDNQSESGFYSGSSSIQSSKSSPTSIYSGRGRGTHLKRNTIPDDPHWMVTNLTDAQFNSISRPKKPDELGTLGQQIQVIANYFPILQYPHKGLVYQYHIHICNRKNLEIRRQHRRVSYNSWLQGLCRRYPQIDKHKIVFDNQSTILVFDEPLPNIDENDVVEMIMGPNRSNRQEAHKVIVQRVGSPVDLSLIQNLTELFDTANESNDRLEDLQKVKQVLSIALHEHCSSHASFIYNRSFYAPAVEGQYGEWDLGLGKQMWRGFYSCLVFAKGKHKLLMNLDVSHTVFLKKQPFLDFLCEIMRQSPCGKQQYSRQRNVQKVDVNDVLRYLDSRSPSYRVEADYLLKHCKYLRVRLQDANKPIIYDIQKLALSASTQEFEWKSNNKRMITVENYYKEHYNLTLKYPSLPTLEMRNRSYLPMELVDVEPVRVKKITDEQRALLCKYSSIKPLDYCKSIKQIRDNPDQQCFEQDPFVAAWNLNVDIKMLTVPARVLPMPEIVYTKEYRVRPEGVRDVGTWELKQTRFHTPTNFPEVWAMINLSSLDQVACEEIYHELSFVAQQRGIDFPVPVIYEERDAEHYSTDQIVDVLKEMMKKNDDCKFFLVILPNNVITRTRIYRDLKKLCELQLGFGIVTQMIRENNAVIGTRKDRTKWDYAKLSNILLKINTKLKGVNSVLQVHDTIERFFTRGHRIMYVGADLSHPAPGAGNQVSVVAVVASADDIPNRYFKEVYKQERPAQTRKESRDIIVSMREIMKSLIQQYEQHRGYPPTAIIIYRDGISEGEFDTVFEKELVATRRACADLSPVYRPCLTYIIVNKRHRTRFFPTDLQKNVSAGTVVDSHDITNATTYDFYLNSQYGALGTSRPTHYHVLYDDNHLKPDEVQMLTYALCYTYARCTRSISIPAPVKYADLLAFRATYYVAIDDGSETESVASGPRIPLNEDIDINNTIRSERIVLSSQIASDCLFFI